MDAALTVTVAGIDLPINPFGTPVNDPTFDINAVPEDTLKKLAACIKHNVAILLLGPTGCGKTASVKWIAEQTGNVYRRIQMTGSTDIDNLIGHWGIKKDEGTVWEDGILVRAMREGEWLLLDEFNMSLPEIITIINSVLDDDRMLRIDNRDGTTTIKAHENFRLFATMNPPDEYAGTKDLNLATKDRFAIINCGYPIDGHEVNIIANHTGISPYLGKNKYRNTSMIQRMVQTAEDIRYLADDKELSTPVSTRQLIQWAKFSKDLHIKLAFELAILSKCNESDKEDVKAVVDKWFENDESFALYEIEEQKEKDEAEAERILEEQKGKAKTELEKKNEELKTFNEQKANAYNAIRSKLPGFNGQVADNNSVAEHDIAKETQDKLDYKVGVDLAMNGTDASVTIGLPPLEEEAPIGEAVQIFPMDIQPVPYDTKNLTQDVVA